MYHHQNCPCGCHFENSLTPDNFSIDNVPVTYTIGDTSSPYGNDNDFNCDDLFGARKNINGSSPNGDTLKNTMYTLYGSDNLNNVYGGVNNIDGYENINYSSTLNPSNSRIPGKYRKDQTFGNDSNSRNNNNNQFNSDNANNINKEDESVKNQLELNLGDDEEEEVDESKPNKLKSAKKDKIENHSGENNKEIRKLASKEFEKCNQVMNKFRKLKSTYKEGEFTLDIEECDTLITTIKYLTNENERLKAEIEDLKKVKDTADNYIKDLEEKLEKKRKKKNSLKIELKRCKYNCDKLQRIVEGYQNLVKNIQDEMKKDKTDAGKLQKINRNLEDFAKNNEEIKETLKNLENYNKAVFTAAVGLKKDFKNLISTQDNLGNPDEDKK